MTQDKSLDRALLTDETLRHLGFTDEELAEIDAQAVESGINLWKASSDR